MEAAAKIESGIDPGIVTGSNPERQGPEPWARRRRSPYPVPVQSLVDGVAEMWDVEPAVGGTLRTHVLVELHDLDDEVDRLRRRQEAGLPLPEQRLRSCVRRYLSLREQWGLARGAA